MQKRQTYVAFLRGINVGGHHKVPMADLRKLMEKLGFSNVTTLLNSGNIVFGEVPGSETNLEENISKHLEKTFGFNIPVLLRTAEEIMHLTESKPFKDVKVTTDTRLYISFLNQMPEQNITLPWISDDGSYQIIDIRDRAIFSVLDISVTQTPQAMGVLEQFFGKNITTRNWNTLERIAAKFNEMNPPAASRRGISKN